MYISAFVHSVCKTGHVEKDIQSDENFELMFARKEGNSCDLNKSMKKFKKNG